MNEAKLRAALAERASAFDPSPGWLDRLGRSEAPNRRRTIAGVSALTVAAVILGVLVAVGADRLWRAPGSETASTGGTSTAGQGVSIALVGYAAPVDGKLPRPLATHLGCMRAHGFDLPDPRWTGRGWLLTLDDPKSLGIGSPRWKRTAFITCALTRPGADLPPRLLRHAIMDPRPRPGGHP